MKYAISLMILVLAAATAVSANPACCSSQEDCDKALHHFANHPVTFFKVDLICNAAPSIGCGSATRHTMSHLEGVAGVAEIWLNRTGTTLAVVWKNAADSERAEAVKQLLETDHRSPQLLKGDEYLATLASFARGDGWYQGSQVDRLSEEEAGIIAARLVRRVQARVTVTAAQAQTLAAAFTDILRADLLEHSTSSKKDCCVEDKLVEATSKVLGNDGITALHQAVAQGYRPLPNEQ